MNHNTFVETINVVQTCTQTGVKDDTENEDKQNDTFSKYTIDELDNVKEARTDSKIKVVSVALKDEGEEVKKKDFHAYFGRNPTGDQLPMYWVQFNFDGGREIQDGSSPLDYESDRNGFLRLVFSILLFMLLLTAAFVAFVYLTDNVRRMFLRFQMFILIGGLIGMVALNYAIMCSGCTRTPPCNFVVLFLALCFMSLIAAAITARYRTEIVLFAILATAGVVVLCIALAYTRFDFTKYILYVIAVAMVFAVLAIIISVASFLMKIRFTPLRIGILVIGTLINVVILIIELQMILGGRTVELGEDDYALAVFMLYTSIVDIFLKLVQLIGICDNM